MGTPFMIVFVEYIFARYVVVVIQCESRDIFRSQVFVIRHSKNIHYHHKMADHFLEQQLPYQKDILQQGLQYTRNNHIWLILQTSYH